MPFVFRVQDHIFSILLETDDVLPLQSKRDYNCSDMFTIFINCVSNLHILLAK